jgi:hypothetical protein
MEASLIMLAQKPHDDAPKLALETLAVMFGRASPSLGVAFTEAHGPEEIHSHLESGPCRNAALMVVFSIADNAEQLRGVIDQLAARANCSDLASVCEHYHPTGQDAEERAAMQERFQKAFSRAPDWMPLVTPDEVCYIF